MENKEFVKLSETHITEHWSFNEKNWDFSLYENFWVGGYFKVPNLSSAYHGLLKQWWDFYNGNRLSDVLLVSEDNDVKKVFKNYYPNWNIKTCNNHFDLQDKSDIISDICDPNSLPKNTFDLIINQATFEHLYDPFGAIKNCIQSLKQNGIMVIHTHPPAFIYHSYPRDYFRFMKDWWYDIPHFLPNVTLLEFYMHNNINVFACYKKL